MKNFLFIASIIFIILTFIGAGYVLYTHGEANAGYAVVPMTISLTLITVYRNKRTEKRK